MEQGAIPSSLSFSLGQITLLTDTHKFSSTYTTRGVLAGISIAVLKHYDQKQLSSNGFISCYSLQSTIQGSEVRNSRQGLRQRSWRNDVHWVAPHGLPFLLSYSSRDYLLRGGTYHSELGCPLTSILNQENDLQAWLLSSLMEVFFSRFIFPYNFSCVKLAIKNNPDTVCLFCDVTVERSTRGCAE